MNINELTKFCTDVRSALEMANADGIHHARTSLSMCDFPMGCCGDTTDLLAYLINAQFAKIALKRSGVYYEHINPDSRLRDGNSHAWLELSGQLIDLTADQFNDRGFSNPPVMITKDKSFHDLFADRDIRMNREVAIPPSLKPELNNSLLYIKEKLKSSGWTLVPS
ncbi:hypothetical protein [Citrobacter freundii]|uniref:hypothetical protein n=1 Tax=Citrobacter freundii TaxID=546 RepID=UPI00178771D3|nr:hypothetical protein [Citrobacter freundii]MBD9992956.1 hypothetical protein [Citrobacter freundii]MBE0055991.1 hypothetical protein [Citrobacter freundii]MDT7290737.1 hypothetical protein [Citrobacter freundii]MEB6429304.1 hypothetical protein [Citrobacter freundii]HBU6167531.1 hypothetical protein [Citrobacter freundii]